MSAMTEKEPTTVSGRIDPKAAQKLVEEAMKQPGVRDLVEAYEEARRYEDAVESYRSVLTSRTVEWASDSTVSDGD